ncbi:type II toxin-antitoxin system PemK/MazF family toxin [soil metagenome]
MVKRGQIWWAELLEPKASEPGFRRPVIVIQADEFNVSRISTVIVLAITSNLHLIDAPGNVRLLKSKTGLLKDSVANVSQLLTLDKGFLSEQIGQLDNSTLRQVDEGLQLVLSL